MLIVANIMLDGSKSPVIFDYLVELGADMNITNNKGHNIRQIAQ